VDKIVFYSGEYIIILVKSVCRGPFIVAVYGVFILRRDVLLHYRGADKSLARPTSRCILFDGENISLDASLVINK
jgi:hypothetical protein